MKKILFFFVVLLAFLPVSCTKNNPTPDTMYSATVTFRPLADGKYYLKQDDSTALVVMNKDLQEYPFEKGKEQRALVSYWISTPDADPVMGFKHTNEVILSSIDTIYTKQPVSAQGQDTTAFGDDIIGLYLGDNVFPTTGVEDGYLNVFFEMPMSNFGIVHEINLLTGTDPSDPYLVELKHNAKGDAYVYSSSFFMNFSLRNLPDTEGRTVPLTVKWHSMKSGEYETVTFDYCSREDW